MNFNIQSFCTETKEIMAVLGWVLTLIKVAIPIIIIVYGIMDLAKAVVASKEDEIKTGAKRLLWRAVAGVAIFFVPNLVIWLFGTIQAYNDAPGFDKCETCLLAPWDCN